MAKAKTGPEDKGLSPADLHAEAAANAAARRRERAAGEGAPWGNPDAPAPEPGAVQGAPQAPTEGPRVWPLLRLDLAELEEPPPPRRWLLRQSTGERADPLFPRGKVGILSAAGGTGKSMALCGLALAVATGRPWLQAGRGPLATDGYGVAEPGRVALLLAEEDRDEVRRRLFYAARLMGLNEAERKAAVARLWIGALAGVDVELVRRDENDNIVEADNAPQLRELLREELARDLEARAADLAADLAEHAGPDGWALVIVDPLSRFGGVDTETDNGAATRAVQALERLTELPGGPAVMVAHHERKGSAKDASAGQEAIRGSSAIVDAARWVARLVPVEVSAGERWETAGKCDAAVLFKLVKTNYTRGIRRPRLLILDKEHHGAMRMATTAEADELAEAEAAAAEAAATKRAKRTKAGANGAEKGTPPRAPERSP